MKLLIRNGRVIDPGNGVDDRLDILAEDGVITSLASGLTSRNAEIIDATGKIVTPGLIDMHVHFRQPGFEYKETIKTGSRAAAGGGFTTVVCQPNTAPPMDNGSRIRDLLNMAREKSIVNMYTMGCITRGRKGNHLANMESSVKAGAVALTDDGSPVVNPEIMEKAAREAVKHSITLCPHCEETRLGGRKSPSALWRKEGLIHRRFSSEAAYIARDIDIARKTDCLIHFQHVSLAKSLSHIRRAKKEGLPVTAEATPHHFTLTQENAREIGPNALMSPPLRTAKDMEAVRKALKDGTIDAIASDHAPHAGYEKASANPPSGVIGLETTLGIVLTHLVHPGILSLPAAIEKMTWKPAGILNIKRGSLGIGMPADITIIDLNKKWTVDTSKFESKGRNCPFNGWQLKGKAVTTIIEGRVVMKDGKILESAAG